MDEYTKDLYTMMFSLQTLQNQGITIRETVYKSLDKLLLWNKESENSKYLELALLHMQAYANMGFALDEENKTIREILKKTGKTREDFFPKGYLLLHLEFRFWKGTNLRNERFPLLQRKSA